MRINFNKELKTITIFPELKELILAKGSINLLSYINSNKHNSISYYKEVIIDIRLNSFLSRVGIRWLYQFILDIRSKGLNPYLVLLDSVRDFMINTGIEEIIEMHTSSSFERTDIDRVIDLEKDLLWNSSIVMDDYE